MITNAHVVVPLNTSRFNKQYYIYIYTMRTYSDRIWEVTGSTKSTVSAHKNATFHRSILVAITHALVLLTI